MGRADGYGFGCFSWCYSWAGRSILSSCSRYLADKKEELAQHQVQKQKADAAFAQSQSEVKRLEDPEYIGQVARKQYGMYLPGETPIWATDATDSK